MVAISTPFPFGFQFPGYDTGPAYIGPWIRPQGATLTTTATRIYYSPFFVAESVTFNRCYTYNQGAGDNGETYRTGAYANGGTNGPGTLILDFGEVTLTGASAVRTQTISLDLSAYVNQWIWLAQHHNTAAAMYDMQTPAQDAAKDISPLMPLFGSDPTNNLGDYNFRYVNTAYGALASTAVTPTAYINQVPLMRLGKA